MFDPVGSRVDLPRLDDEVLKLWKERNVFHRTESERENGPRFMLYEGPPTANGRPGIHHVLARVFKDVIPRHRTMKGYKAFRKGGWDTHGLPVELEVEKELGLKSKREVEEYGIEKFNQKCRESVFRYIKEWETMTDRIGYWVDMQHPYVTLDNDYIETIWWLLRQYWDKGLLYQDMKGTPHCPRCVTSLSSHEVAQGYEENTPDPSVFVKFEVTSGSVLSHGPRHSGPIPPTYLLAWTTTPWTLPGNVALAVKADADYAVVKLTHDGKEQRLVLAETLLGKAIKGDYEIEGRLKGAELEGSEYRLLYEPWQYDTEVKQFVEKDLPGVGKVTALERVERFTPHVVVADFVSLEDGTGIVHIAPAFGDEDLHTGREKHLAFVQQVDLTGNITGTYPFAGKFVKEADGLIMRDLQGRGLLYHRETYRHTYPFCWRCHAPLLYYAKTSWYIRTTALKDQLVEGNQGINWYPEHIKDGRYGEWLRNNVDWAISRERFWGTPLPIWRCGSCNRFHCVASRAELKERATAESKLKLENLDMHRPYVDDINIACPHCKGTMERVPDVLDVWFDSGAMPFAQFHYPFENKELLDDGRFPAEYICEAMDQTRGWFYSLQAVSTLLTGVPSYKNVICLGLILDEQGRKMSKSVGNTVNPWDVLSAHGGDAVRWYLLTATSPGEPRRFSANLVSEVVRRFLLTLWNTYVFFVTYANLDNFDPKKVKAGWKPANDLDRWALSELNALVRDVDLDLENYNPTDAGRKIEAFVDVLSNWYVRRSRRRFWKGDSDEDKTSAYMTLYTCLTTVTKLMAPLAPFMAESMYQNLVCKVDPDATDSVHLATYPVADESAIDRDLMEATRLAMRVASLGRAARAKANIKVRQPLPKVLVQARSKQEQSYLERISSQVLDELNAKELAPIAPNDPLIERARQAAGGKPDAALKLDSYAVALDPGLVVLMDTTVTPELAAEGLARELVHRVQMLRRAAGFDIADRIITYFEGDQHLLDSLKSYTDYVKAETLSENLVTGAPAEGAHSEKLKLEGHQVTLGVKRV